MNTPKFDYDKIIKLYEELVPDHRSLSEIAKLVGCSKSLVAKVVNDHLKDKKPS